MINKNIRYDFDDLLIEPEAQTDIMSRQHVNPYDSFGYLPLFTAPMDTVINSNNKETFNLNKIRTILPRQTEVTNYISDYGNWKAYSLDQFEETFIKEKGDMVMPVYALIDIANGHMLRLKDAVRDAKKMHGDKLIVMAGNIANPKTYYELSKAGADYVRVGIGNGGGCLTTVQTGIGYPMASLIDECFKIKCKENLKSKIVADGGMKNYDDIIKSLGLGADYVMIGSLLNKALESASPTYVHVPQQHGFYLTYNEYISKKRGTLTIEKLLEQKRLYKRFRGMSTKAVQKQLGKTEPTTSEGISTMVKVEYKLQTWIDNFTDYLRSAMSYTNSINLDEFIGNVNLNIITVNAKTRYNK